MSRNATLVIATLTLGLAGPGSAAPTRVPNPRDFVRRVTNPWFPLEPGTTYVYAGVKDGKRARDVVMVTKRTKLVLGVQTTVVHDLLYLRGRLEERTSDWYAEDNRGNVWYFGEATAELDAHGRVRTREGSWEAGKDGARAGLFMPAHPQIGDTGLQEYRRGQAEDHFRVLSVSAKVRVPFVTSQHALLTKEWTPLEPGVVDHKYYVRGIGTVKEVTAKGPKETNILVSVRRS
jgi:hypothetical protein